MGKAYEGTVHLGISSNTGDAEGEVLERVELPELSEQQIGVALERFQGRITQQVPAFSAIKVEGERLYAKARRGESFEPPSREVEIYEIQLLEWKAPQLRLMVRCSKGTYIRSLAVDIGQALGLPAHLCQLRRTQVGHMNLEQALSLDASDEALEAVILPPARALAHLPSLGLEGEALKDVEQGRKRIYPGAAPGIHAGLDPEGRLRALMEISPEGLGRVLRGFPLEP